MSYLDLLFLSKRYWAVRLLPHLSGGDLFAYLFRRFGYPDLGWDGSKELVNYCLTTPMPEVFLLVRPYMGGDYAESDRSRLMFGHYVGRAIQEEYYTCLHTGGHAAWPKHPRYKEVEQALSATLRDLLRPVYVDDVPTNCYGKVDDTQKVPPAVDAYSAAGYPIPAEFFASVERWERFIDALAALGDGSLDVGIDAVIKMNAGDDER